MLFCPVGWGNLKERDKLEDPGIGVKMIVIIIIINGMGGCGVY